MATRPSNMLTNLRNSNRRFLPRSYDLDTAYMERLSCLDALSALHPHVSLSKLAELCWVPRQHAVTLDAMIAYLQKLPRI